MVSMLQRVWNCQFIIIIIIFICDRLLNTSLQMGADTRTTVMGWAHSITITHGHATLLPCRHTNNAIWGDKANERNCIRYRRNRSALWLLIIVHYTNTLTYLQSVTCHPAEVTFPAEACSRLSDPGGMQAELTMPQWFSAGIVLFIHCVVVFNFRNLQER